MGETKHIDNSHTLAPLVERYADKTEGFEMESVVWLGSRGKGIGKSLLRSSV